MTIHLPSTFTPGHVFRTRDLAVLTPNPSRLAQRWVTMGAVSKLRKGLFAVPNPKWFGNAPPREEDLLGTFLKGTPFIETGPPAWNPLRLGSTQLFAHPLIYNQLRSGTFDLDGRVFRLRRVRFPYPPPLEWFVIDLLENLESVCLSPEEAERGLTEQLEDRRFDPGRLLEMAADYGTHRTRALVQRALSASRVGMHEMEGNPD